MISQLRALKLILEKRGGWGGWVSYRNEKNHSTRESSLIQDLEMKENIVYLGKCKYSLI